MTRLVQKIVIFISFPIWNFAASRTNVQIQGATTSPNFVRLSEPFKEPCPLSHPYAFNNGENCCQHFHKYSDFRQDIQYEDSLNQCLTNIPCPSIVGKCMEAKDLAKVNCAAEYPFGAANYKFCCRDILKLNKPELDHRCDGTRLKTTDPAECCERSQICQGGTRKCKGTQFNQKGEILLMRQDLNVAPYYFTADDYFSLNRDNPRASHFSRLEDFDDRFRSDDGFFYFKLCYPAMSAENPCLEFRQLSDPLREADRQSDVVAGLKISKYLVQTNDQTNFNGFRSDTRQSAILDGNDGSNGGYWWYSIGTTEGYGGIQIPASQGTLTAKFAELYVVIN